MGDDKGLAAALVQLRGLFSKKLFPITAIGFLLIVVALSIETFAHPEPGVWQLLVHLARDLGIAFLIAALICISVEISHRKELTQMLDSKIEMLAGNVFKGVFNNNLPTELIDEAIAIAFTPKLIREDMVVRYTLQSKQSDGVPYVEVVADISFAMKNVTNHPEEFKLGVTLPNPILPQLKSQTKLNSFQIGTVGPDSLTPIAQDDVNAANDMFQEELKDDARRSGVARLGEQTVFPGQRLYVKALYVMAKEEEDTELLTTLYAANGINLQVFNKLGPDMMLHGQLVHRETNTRLLPIPSNSDVYELKHNGYFLPHQGVQFWWKRKNAIVANNP